MAKERQSKRRGASSNRWLARQHRDRYVKEAVAEGHISRAHFKLKELDERCRLLRPGLRVLELGAAPGGWTRYLEQKICPGLGNAALIACDPRPISASADTVVIQAAYGELEADAALSTLLDDAPLDLVLSDMAPNMSGIRAADQARAMDLADLTLDAAQTWLKPGGSMVVKLFQGEGMEAWVDDCRNLFDIFRLIKPKSSRSESRELYGVGLEFLRPV